MTKEQKRIPSSGRVERLETQAGQHVRHALLAFHTTTASEGRSTELVDDIGDDTIELALTKEDMLALSRAAEEEHADARPAESALITTGSLPRGQSVRSRRWPPLLASSALGIAVSIALGVVAHRISTVTITPPRATEGSAESLASPVRFSNPFDASEVFEFPPGTSDDQARQSVAAILLQRARDRHGADAGKGNAPMPGATTHRARLARSPEPHRT